MQHHVQLGLAAAVRVLRGRRRAGVGERGGRRAPGARAHPARALAALAGARRPTGDPDQRHPPTALLTPLARRATSHSKI